MAKNTAVIDIGSNSMRMAVFEKTSRFGFHLIHEVKSSVRLGENAYKNGGYIQDAPMRRAEKAINEFLLVAKSFGARKILCVATSALRDAPNASEFTSLIKRKYNLSIKIIDGHKEALYGGIACANLLPKMTGLTVDIGGGSTEFSLIENGKVLDTYTLNIGTVRIKELFFDEYNIEGAISYIDDALSSLPHFPGETLIGVGGTFRALSRAIMKKEHYPIKKIHGFTISASAFDSFGTKVIETDQNKLKNLNIKPDRYDTIKPGTLILLGIMKFFKIKHMVCSGVGVREGLFLSDLLRHSSQTFPSNFNPSVRYLLDKFASHSDHGLECSHLVKRLFDLFSTDHNLPLKYRSALSIAAKLLPIGIGVRYYAYQRHSHYLVLNTLDYGLEHSQIALISALLLFKKGKPGSSQIPKELLPLLPQSKTFDLLYAILWLSHILLAQRQSAQKISLNYHHGLLQISGDNLYLAQEQITNVIFPKTIRIQIDA